MRVAVVVSTMDLGWLPKHLEAADTDLLWGAGAGFVQALVGAEADAARGAPLGARSAGTVNQRHGYRPRRLDTRVGTLELEIPVTRSSVLVGVPETDEPACRRNEEARCGVRRRRSNPRSA
jgi:hypothetical protein